MPPADRDPVQQHRRALTGLAYRMLGNLPEAEDVVQDAWIRWSAKDRSDVLDPLAFLVRVVTRLCLDVLGSPRVRRVDHVGYRLPEPARTDVPPLGPLETAVQRDTLSLALLDLLDRCSPLERAAWVLHEAFALPHAEVADVLGVSPAAARQLASRASRRLTDGAPARTARPTARQRQDVLTSFLVAAGSGDVGQLAALLLEDATLWSDGGGRVSAARRPVVGRDRVARFMIGVASRGSALRLDVLEMVGGPVLVALDGDAVVQVVEVDPGPDGCVAALRMVSDPRSLERAAG